MKAESDLRRLDSFIAVMPDGSKLAGELPFLGGRQNPPAELARALRPDDALHLAAFSPVVQFSTTVMGEELEPSLTALLRTRNRLPSGATSY